MKKLILAIVCSVLPALGFAAGGNVHLDKVDVDLSNKESLQRGAKFYVNYCMGCHSLQYMSYGRMSRDLDLTKEQVFDNLMFVWDGKKNLGDYMKISMPGEQSLNWFGVTPPDLTLVTRNRGESWLYTYLRSFYVDESRPFGVNNTVFPDVGMPHVLWELEGAKKAVFEETVDANGQNHKAFAGFERVSAGSMSEAQYDQAIRDLVTFLAYAGEPGKLARQQLGVWVILFLVVFFFIAYALKKEYWKDIH